MRAVRSAYLVVLAFAVLGAALGAIWPHAIAHAKLERFANGVGQGQLQLSRVWSADGWFVLLGGVAGLAAGVVVGALRRLDAVVAVLGVVVGSVLAALFMATIGRLLGPDDPARMLAGAAVGTTADASIAWPPLGAMLAWPFAALVGVLAGLFTRPDESTPEESAAGGSAADVGHGRAGDGHQVAGSELDVESAPPARHQDRAEEQR